jgi:hypothetical protein
LLILWRRLCTVWSVNVWCVFKDWHERKTAQIAIQVNWTTGFMRRLQLSLGNNNNNNNNKNAWRVFTELLKPRLHARSNRNIIIAHIGYNSGPIFYLTNIVCQIKYGSYILIVDNWWCCL